MESDRPTQYTNMILRSMAGSDMERLAPHLSLVSLTKPHLLHAPGNAVKAVYFLEDGICSVVATMSQGSTAEVGIIGRDGFVGLPAILGTSFMPNRYVIQISGYGFRVDARILLQQFNASQTLRDTLFRSVQGQLVQSAQTAACNRLHEVPQRLARWLLMCRDRVQVDQIEITQEILAMMLGTRRSSVTVAAHQLQEKGLISYTRGRVAIHDRVGLEHAACECYRVVHSEFVRLGLFSS